jgi:hypothetical protein
LDARLLLELEKSISWGAFIGETFTEFIEIKLALKESVYGISIIEEGYHEDPNDNIPDPNHNTPSGPPSNQSPITDLTTENSSAENRKRANLAYVPWMVHFVVLGWTMMF